MARSNAASAYSAVYDQLRLQPSFGYLARFVAPTNARYRRIPPVRRHQNTRCTLPRAKTWGGIRRQIDA